MSSEAAPINPARFAEALRELPASSLALKVFELRNSMAHLDYSNAELKPFAEGRALTLDTVGSTEPDQDCIDAIAENEAVIARMLERIALIKTEVENRGLSWAEFQGKEEEKPNDTAAATTNGDAQSTATDSEGLANGANGQPHPAWTDGTFQTGTIWGLGDEELARRLEERMAELEGSDNEGDTEGGVHL